MDHGALPSMTMVLRLKVARHAVLILIWPALTLFRDQFAQIREKLEFKLAHAARLALLAMESQATFRVIKKRGNHEKSKELSWIFFT